MKLGAVEASVGVVVLAASVLLATALFGPTRTPRSRRRPAPACSNRVRPPIQNHRPKSRGPSRKATSESKAKGPPAMAWSLSPAVRSGWVATILDARCRTGSRGHRLQLLDGSDRGHQPPVRPNASRKPPIARSPSASPILETFPMRRRKSWFRARSSSHHRPDRYLWTIRWFGGGTYPAQLAASRGAGYHDRRERRLSGRADLLVRRRRLRQLGWQAVADRGGVGTRSPRRQGAHSLCLGR